MSQETQAYLEEVKKTMQATIVHLEREFQKIRTGKASPQMLEGVKVDYYGTLTPLEQIANVNTPDPKQIVVQAWDKSALGAIDKAILAANLGFTPRNDGEVLRINVPALTEERRKELAKKAKTEAENTKVSIRNIRRAANEKAKKLEKENIPEDEIKKMEADIQKLTDDYIKKTDSLFEAKEKDIMTI